MMSLITFVMSDSNSQEADSGRDIITAWRANVDTREGTPHKAISPSARSLAVARVSLSDDHSQMEEPISIQALVKLKFSI